MPRKRQLVDRIVYLIFYPATYRHAGRPCYLGIGKPSRLDNDFSGRGKLPRKGRRILRRLIPPPEMLTERGREELERVRSAA